MWNHVVARTYPPQEPLRSFESARALWRALQAQFPRQLAAVLMPNHLHLILPGEEEDVVGRLGHILSGMARREGESTRWQPIPPPAPIPDRHHLRRQIRYVALNPCRARLSGDPLEWVWSTYRDVVGAAAGRPLAPRVAAALGDSGSGFAVRFHDYVSGDPSVEVNGTGFPAAAPRRKWAQEGLGEILAAAAAALRVHPTEVETVRSPLRPMFLHLALRQGWAQASVLAHMCGMSPRGIHHVWRRPPPAGIDAAALCLGDVRLRRMIPVRLKT